MTIPGVDNKSCTNQGFRSTNTGDLDAAMQGTDGFRILLSHDPTHWATEVVPQTDIPLTLSGHTHAAQIKLFGYIPASWTFKHTHGMYVQDGQTLYINIGLGCTAPFRLGASPEITVITLR
jgi:predicted MPP superfamily phosphohydrolase